MAANDGVRDPIDWQPMRREHDRIALLEQQVRLALFTGQISTNIPPLDFSAIVRYVSTRLTDVMQELIVEVWLHDILPTPLGSADSLQCIAGATRSGPFTRSAPDDLILAVMTASRPLRFDDAPDHPLVRDWAGESGVTSATIEVFLGLPIGYRDEILGVLAVAMPAAPSVEHIALLDTIAAELGMAAQIERYRRRHDRHEDVADAVLNEAPLAAAVLARDDFSVILTNPRFDHLLRLGPDCWGQPLEQVLPEHFAALRKAWQMDDVLHNGAPRVMLDMPVQLPEGLSYWDFTVAPLRDDRQLIAGLVITGVDVTAHVLQRQRQRRAVDIAQERVSQMVSLHQISLEVAAQLGQDPDALLHQILEKMARVVDATGGLVYLADRESGDLEVIISYGLSQDYTRTRLRRSEGLAGRVYVTGQGQMVTDYRRYPLRASAFADAPFGAVAAVPMQQRGQVAGVICLIQEVRPDGTPKHRRRQDEVQEPFTAEDIWLLELFATQAAHAIENARTFLDLERAYQQQRGVDRQKDDFLARASHDLRLPLTSVIGYLDLALGTLGESSTTRMLVQQAAEEAQRLREMLDDMMAQLRHDGPKRDITARPLELGPIIQDVVVARRKQITLHGTRHRIILRLAEPLQVLGDRTGLKEILENLISNAIKYSPSGGDITIEAQAQDDTAGDALALITIRDQGIGIPDEAHEQIFQRFMRVESPLASEIRGDGIGLYLARQLVESMGGAIWLAESSPGAGSVFAFTLPLASATAEDITLLGEAAT